MSTELQRQVLKLREQHVEAASLAKGRPSLFLSLKEAAGVDVEVIYESAINSLQVLQQYDDRFDSYFKTLLHHSSVSLQRELQTAEENKNLNKQIDGLLSLLTLFCYELHCHKVLEYLVRRYRIHEFNAASFIKCMIPCHDTKIFARVVQLTSIKNSEWMFLDGLKKSGIPLPRVELVKQCHKDTAVLEAICDIVSKATKLSMHKNSSSVVIEGYGKILSFFTAVVMELSEYRPLEDNHIRTLIPILVDGLKTKSTISIGIEHPKNLFRRSNIMIAIQLARKASLSLQVSVLILKLLMEAFHHVYDNDCELDGENMRISNETVSAILLFSKFQTFKLSSEILDVSFPQKSLSLIEMIKKIKNKIDPSHFIVSLVKGLTDYIFTLENDAIQPDDAADMIQKIILDNLVDNSLLVLDMIENLYFSTLNISSKLKKSYGIRILKVFSQKFPDDFDNFVSKVLKQYQNQDNLDDMRQLFVDIFVDSKYRLPDQSGTTLLLSLSSPLPVVRSKAIENYVAFVSPPDSTTITFSAKRDLELVGISKAVLYNLLDQDYMVAKIAWQYEVIQRLVQYVPIQELLDIIRNAFYNWSVSTVHSNEQSKHMLTLIVQSFSCLDIIPDLDSVFINLTDLQYSMNAITWIQLVILVLIGKDDIDLSSVAFDIACKLSNTLPLFNELKQTKSKQTFIELIAHSIHNNIAKSDRISDVEEVIKCCAITIELTSSHLYPVMTIVNSVLELSLNNLNQNSSIRLCKALHLLILKAVELIDNSTESQQRILNSAIRKLIIQLKDMKDELIDDKLWIDIISAPINLHDIKFQLILVLLRYSQLIDSLGFALVTLYPNDYIQRLIQIIFCKDSLVNDTCKATSLHVLATFLHFGSPSSDTKESQVSNLLLFLVPICLYATSSSNASIRMGAVSLASKVQLKKDEFSVLSTIQFDGHKYDLSCIIHISEILKRRCNSSMTSDDAILSGIKVDIINEKLNVSHICTLFGLIIKTLSWRLPHVSSILVNVLSIFPLESTWDILKICLIHDDDKLIDSLDGKDIKAIYKSIFQSLKGITQCKLKMQQDVIHSLVQLFIIQATTQSRLVIYKHEYLVFIQDLKDINNLSSELVYSIYQSLMDELSHSNDSKLINDTILRLNPSMKFIFTYFSSFVKILFQDFERSLGDTSEDDNSSMIIGMSIPIYQTTTIVETLLLVVSQTIKSNETLHDKEELINSHGLCCQLMDVFVLFCHSRLRLVHTLEYSKAMILELFNQMKPFFTRELKASKGLVYDSNRIEKDLSHILSSLSNSNNIQFQASALDTIRLLIESFPTSARICIDYLSHVLSSSNTSTINQRDDLIVKILQAVVVSSNEFSLSNAQEIVSSLCLTFPKISSKRRWELSKLILQVIGSRGLSILTNVLLALSLRNYSSSSSTNVAIDNDMLIILSKSYQQKAYRELVTSNSEELYKLAIELSIHQQPTLQMSNLIVQMKFIRFLIGQALNENDLSEELSSSADVKTQTPLLLNGKKSISYLWKLWGLENASYETCLGIIFVTLEFIVDMLRYKSFHRHMLQELEKSREDAKVLQNLFVEFTEQLLILITQATTIQQLNFKYIIRVGEDKITLNAAVFGKTLSNQSLEILQVMQRVLDTPTFVQVIEELLYHSNTFIRFKALQILSSRLNQIQETSNTASIDERPLFLDLLNKLRQYLQTTFSSIQKSFDEISLENDQIGLSQSALLCIDSLVRFLAGGVKHESEEFEGWMNTIIPLFEEILSVGNTVSIMITLKTVNSKKVYQKITSSASYLGLVKLQGSILLSYSTMTKSLGPRALKSLATIMTSILESIEFHSIRLKDTELESDIKISLFKARCLTIRSSISAASCIIRTIPQFIHPYLEKIIRFLLPLYKLSIESSLLTETNVIASDIDICFQSILDNVPMRLLIPSIYNSTSDHTILSNDYFVSSKLTQWIHSLFSCIDRNTMGTHISTLCSLATLLLDYRRIHGNNLILESNNMDEVAVESVVDLCLKFTEVELKTFLLKLFDWKNVIFDSDEDDNEKWRSLSRSVNFYRLTFHLSTKLRSIFVPIMSNFWLQASESLNEFKSFIEKEKNIREADLIDLKGKKKRKNKQQVESIIEKRNEQQIQEFLKRNEFILGTIGNCCLFGDINCIDVNTFDILMKSIISYFDFVQAFNTTDDYLKYCESHVIPCLAYLARNSNSELQWKPLNYKVLQYMRDDRRIVKIAALRALHKLFKEVGEEYLLLLPECLSYLSELLEDDEVAKETNTVIRFIEDLSGEKLDSYLQL